MMAHVRTITATVTVTLSLLLTAFVTTHAQSNALRARIPFAFSAGSKVLDAGVYTIGRSDSSQGMLVVRSFGNGAFVMTQRGHAPGSPGKPRFVFRRYGRQYFLREVWFAESGGYTLPETRQERQAAAEATKVASLHSTVTIEAALD